MADIRDFTTLAESIHPEETVAMLNDYFGRMIDVVFRYEGTVDKFMGDAIMAVFGTPVEHPDKQLRAVLAAIEMRRALRVFNQRRQTQGKSPISIGVGICDGEVVSGAIGSEDRLDFTVIGDSVNTVARLESLTKDFPEHKVVFNETVFELVKEQVPCEYLAEVIVKGKTQPVKVFGISERFVYTAPLPTLA
jgi:adenylate cyclase